MLRDVQTYSEYDKKLSPTEILPQLYDNLSKILDFYIKKVFFLSPL